MKIVETKQGLEEIIRILENEKCRLKRIDSRENDVIVNKINKRLKDYRIEYYERFKSFYDYYKSSP